MTYRKERILNIFTEGSAVSFETLKKSCLMQAWVASYKKSPEPLCCNVRYNPAMAAGMYNPLAWQLGTKSDCARPEWRLSAPTASCFPGKNYLHTNWQVSHDHVLSPSLSVFTDSVVLLSKYMKNKCKPSLC